MANEEPPPPSRGVVHSWGAGDTFPLPDPPAPCGHWASVSVSRATHMGWAPWESGPGGGCAGPWISAALFATFEKQTVKTRFPHARASPAQVMKAEPYTLGSARDPTGRWRGRRCPNGSSPARSAPPGFTRGIKSRDKTLCVAWWVQTVKKPQSYRKQVWWPWPACIWIILAVDSSPASTEHVRTNRLVTILQYYLTFIGHRCRGAGALHCVVPSSPMGVIVFLFVWDIFLFSSPPLTPPPPLWADHIGGSQRSQESSSR